MVGGDGVHVGCETWQVDSGEVAFFKTAFYLPQYVGEIRLCWTIVPSPTAIFDCFACKAGPKAHSQFLKALKPFPVM